MTCASVASAVPMIVRKVRESSSCRLIAKSWSGSVESAMVWGHETTVYSVPIAETGTSSDASFEKTPTLSSGLNW